MQELPVGRARVGGAHPGDARRADVRARERALRPGRSLRGAVGAVPVLSEADRRPYLRGLRLHRPDRREAEGPSLPRTRRAALDAVHGGGGVTGQRLSVKAYGGGVAYRLRLRCFIWRRSGESFMVRCFTWGRRCVSLAARCFTWGWSCVSLAARCFTWGWSCASLAARCFAWGRSSASFAARCFAWGRSCVSLAARCFTWGWSCASFAAWTSVNRLDTWNRENYAT